MGIVLDRPIDAAPQQPVGPGVRDSQGERAGRRRWTADLTPPGMSWRRIRVLIVPQVPNPGPLHRMPERSNHAKTLERR